MVKDIRRVLKDGILSFSWRKKMLHGFISLYTQSRVPWILGCIFLGLCLLLETTLFFLLLSSSNCGNWNLFRCGELINIWNPNKIANHEILLHYYRVYIGSILLLISCTLICFVICVILCIRYKILDIKDETELHDIYLNTFDKTSMRISLRMSDSSMLKNVSSREMTNMYDSSRISSENMLQIERHIMTNSSIFSPNIEDSSLGGNSETFKKTSSNIISSENVLDSLNYSDNEMCIKKYVSQKSSFITVDNTINLNVIYELYSDKYMCYGLFIILLFLPSIISSINLYSETGVCREYESALSYSYIKDISYYMCKSINLLYPMYPLILITCFIVSLYAIFPCSMYLILLIIITMIQQISFLYFTMHCIMLILDLHSLLPNKLINENMDSLMIFNLQRNYFQMRFGAFILVSLIQGLLSALSHASIIYRSRYMHLWLVPISFIACWLDATSVAQLFTPLYFLNVMCDINLYQNILANNTVLNIAKMICKQRTELLLDLGILIGISVVSIIQCGVCWGASLDKKLYNTNISDNKNRNSSFLS